MIYIISIPIGEPTHHLSKLTPWSITRTRNPNPNSAASAERRLGHVRELVRMGATASVSADGRTVDITGVASLRASAVCAGDLRAGAALVLAALSADGTSTVSGLEHIDRGYEDFARKLRDIGADVERIDVL